MLGSLLLNSYSGLRLRCRSICTVIDGKFTSSFGKKISENVLHTNEIFVKHLKFEGPSGDHFNDADTIGSSEEIFITSACLKKGRVVLQEHSGIGDGEFLFAEEYKAAKFQGKIYKKGDNIRFAFTDEYVYGKIESVVKLTFDIGTVIIFNVAKYSPGYNRFPGYALKALKLMYMPLFPSITSIDVQDVLYHVNIQHACQYELHHYKYDYAYCALEENFYCKRDVNWEKTSMGFTCKVSKTCAHIANPFYIIFD